MPDDNIRGNGNWVRGIQEHYILPSQLFWEFKNFPKLVYLKQYYTKVYHLSPIRPAKTKKFRSSPVIRLQGNKHPHTRYKTVRPLWGQLGNFLRSKEVHTLMKFCLFIVIYWSTICNNRRLETTHVSFYRKLDNKMAYPNRMDYCVAVKMNEDTLYMLTWEAFQTILLRPRPKKARCQKVHNLVC